MPGRYRASRLRLIVRSVLLTPRLAYVTHDSLAGRVVVCPSYRRGRFASRIQTTQRHRLPGRRHGVDGFDPVRVAILRDAEHETFRGAIDALYRCVFVPALLTDPSQHSHRQVRSPASHYRAERAYAVAVARVRANAQDGFSQASHNSATKQELSRAQ